MMKKTMVLFLALLLAMSIILNSSFALAENETIAIRNGISFGMTKEQVLTLETGKRDYSVTHDGGDECYKYTEISVSGINNCEIWYYFSDDGELYRVRIDLFPDVNKSISSSTAKSRYVNLNNRLSTKYGAPLGNSNGYTHPVTTKTLYYGFQQTNIFKTLASINGAYTYSDYDEWIVPSETGYMKIEHFMFYYKDGADTDFTHAVGYQFYSLDEWQQELDEYSDGL